MTEPIFATLVKLNELCGRAVDYRRSQLAEMGADPIDLRYNVRFSVPFRDLKRRPDGWVHIANLMDDITGQFWHIVWEPETDRVRIYGPR
jgi:hypothetical protein